jgi:hypothetical protein
MGYIVKRKVFSAVGVIKQCGQKVVIGELHTCAKTKAHQRHPDKAKNKQSHNSFAEFFIS